MKLPKGFGGQGFAGALAQAQEAMSKAKNLDQELASETVKVEQNGIVVVFDGRGEPQSLKIDPNLIDPSDVDGLESALVAALRLAYERANDLRTKRTQEIMPNIPGLDQLGF
ncbi:MAG: YbaB/EbfC family nucleoid-associated protein [Armatimonadetes bacterium]|nr:YbaB/EbfC family nucleoid-associated protein [Armatimonadota bacterium]